MARLVLLEIQYIRGSIGDTIYHAKTGGLQLTRVLLELCLVNHSGMSIVSIIEYI